MDSEQKVRWFLLVVLVSVGLVTFKDFAGAIIHLGNVKLTGPGGSFEDNNDYALLLVMTTPLAYYFAKSEGRWILRWGFYGLSAMTGITILFTYSRGGFLGLCVVALMMALKTKYKVTGLAALTLAAQLVQAGHFVLHRQGMYAELTAAGREIVERCSANGIVPPPR